MEINEHQVLLLVQEKEEASGEAGTGAHSPKKRSESGHGLREIGQHPCNSRQVILLRLLPSLANSLEVVFVGGIENAMFISYFLLLLKIQRPLWRDTSW